MNINGAASQTIWLKSDDPTVVQIYDQRSLPHKITIVDLISWEDAAASIKEMWVRGAPLIGVTAAYGLYLGALKASASDWKGELQSITEALNATRPTAVNLAWALKEQWKVLEPITALAEAQIALRENAQRLAIEDVETCRRIGTFGLEIIESLAAKKPGQPVNILTHCNAGWLATIDWGTATSPIYQAHAKGIKVHVWVDETRPRNQGANLTAFELNQQGVPHTLITDNTGGHLMQHGMVDMVIVGTDRTTRTGDVANKIGTYLKALAAHDNQVPFYVALPSSTIDWSIADGLSEIPIEMRHEDEVKRLQGLTANNEITSILICPETTPAANYGFDVTPARLVTGLITEKGICDASEEGLLKLFPERKN